MKKSIPTKKDSIQAPNKSMTSRAQNKKITYNMTETSKNLSSKNNIHQNGPKKTKSNNIKNINNNNNNIIYDKEFISYINKLSEIIKTLQKSNATNFTTMKNILENQNNNIKSNKNTNTNINNNQNKNTEKENNNYYENLNTINNSFNHIESAFNNFYTNAIVLF